jgi:hypothetical protein
MRSLFRKTARKAAKIKAGPLKEKIIKIDKEWGNRETWAVIKRLGKPFTLTHRRECHQATRAATGACHHLAAHPMGEPLGYHILFVVGLSGVLSAVNLAT